jgi:hypothetical protein
LLILPLSAALNAVGCFCSFLLVFAGSNSRGPPGMIQGGGLAAIMDVLQSRCAKPEFGKLQSV